MSRNRLLQQFAGFCEPSRFGSGGERGESQTETKVIRGFTAGRDSGVLAQNIVEFLFRGGDKVPCCWRGENVGGGLRRKGTFGGLRIGFLKRLSELLNEPLGHDYFFLEKHDPKTRRRFYYLWLKSFII